MRPLSLQPASPVLPLCNPRRPAIQGRQSSNAWATTERLLSFLCAISGDRRRSFGGHSAMFLRPRRLMSIQNRSLSDLECQGIYMPGSDAFSISPTTCSCNTISGRLRMSNQLLLHAAILQGQHDLLVNQTPIAITRRRAETDRQRRKRPRAWWVRP